MGTGIEAHAPLWLLQLPAEHHAAAGHRGHRDREGRGRAEPSEDAAAVTET